MGIKGLTTFISNQKGKYLRPYELCNTYVIVDGNSLSCQLYNSIRQCNSAFGGDYDIYARSLDKFFKELDQCNVIPLVFFDGAMEDKKLPTHVSRTKDKIRRASVFCDRFLQYPIFPLFLKRVTLEVLKQRNIKYTQTLFEADNEIAAVARILSCPVLSYDSDFFVLGSSYIPLDTLQPGVRRKSPSVVFKECKIYCISTFLQNFEGLDESVFPLCSMLLGNDYTSRLTFKNFDSQIKINKTKNNQNESQIRIREVFKWLRNKTLNQAVAGILGTFPRDQRKQVLVLIEQMLQHYTYVPTDILLRFGFDKKYILEKNRLLNVKPFKFQGDTYNLPLTVDEKNEFPLTNIETIDPDKINDAVGHLPMWFLEDFKNAKLPDYFLDVIIRRLYISRVQIEDSTQPCSIKTSWNILKTIYAILGLGCYQKPEDTLMVMYRGDKSKLEREKLPYPQTISDRYNLGTLEGLRNIPLHERKKIIIDTLLIENPSLLEELPDRWRLYVGTMNYWIKEMTTSTVDKAHIYAILFTLLIEVVDAKIGYVRNMKTFENKFSKHLQQKSNDLKRFGNSLPGLGFVLTNITKQDCISAWPFFSTLFQTKDKLLMQTKTFKISVVHTFGIFQSCLWHSIDLNALLGCPYPQAIIKDLYTGTFLYNLYTNLQTRVDLDKYITTVLNNSPSLLHLFQLLVNKVQFIWCSLTSESKLSAIRQKKRQRRKKPKPPSRLEEIDFDELNLNDKEDKRGRKKNNVQCINNRYYLLGFN